MSEEIKKVSTEDDAADTAVADVTKSKASKAEKKSNKEKKPNFFVRTWKKLCKFMKDVRGEMRKVVWTPKDELAKSTKIVLAAVIAIGLMIAAIDLSFSKLINFVAGLVG